MIKLNISTLVFFYTLFSAMVILIIWIASGYRQRKDAARKDVEYMWKCSVCGNIYVDSRHEDISVCPLCESFNKREVAK